MPALQQSSRQKQSAVVTQSMVQACSILSMNIEELQEYIQNAALENPLISFESFSHIPAYDASADSRGFTEAVIDFGGQMAEANGFFEGTTRLRDYLIMQIPKRLNDRQYKVFYYIINSLDKNGFFREAETSAAGRLGVPTETVSEMLDMIRPMDPSGVGAADLRQCFLIQLKRDRSRSELAIRLLEDEYDSLCRNRLKEVSHRLGCTISEIYEAIELIRTLESRPSRMFDREVPRYIIPDVTVSPWEDNFAISLNKEFLPEVRLDETYCCMEDFDSDAKVWLAEKKKQASAIQHFVQKRNSTLLLVCTEIFRCQKMFFFKGPEYLCRLKQKDVAAALGCHESTVFRAVNGKYLSCSWGTFPLTYFFSNTIECEDEDIPCNPKNQLKYIVDSEDKASPLSDSKIACMLSEQGLRISRRTVAKYREEAGIPASSLRKKY